MEKLKIGVLGAGYLGQIHLNCILQCEHYNLIGFYDESKEVAEKTALDKGIQSFHSIDDLLDMVDVVDIVTPTSTHFDLAKYCLEKGKHIFIEKPICETVTQAKELILLAKANNLKGQVGHVERFNPAFKTIEKQLGNPMFIESHRLAQFNIRGTDVPVVLDLMIHDIDIILKIINSPVSKVSASGVSVISDTPDIANARIEFENGAVANLTSSRISLKGMRKLRCFQKDAYITIDFLNKTNEVIKLQDVDNEDQSEMMTLVTQNGKRKQIIMTPTTVSNSNAILEELSSFALAIIEDTTPIVTLEHAKNSLEVAYLIIDCFKK